MAELTFQIKGLSFSCCSVISTALQLFTFTFVSRIGEKLNQPVYAEQLTYTKSKYA